MNKEQLINRHARNLKSLVGTGLAIDECQDIIKYAVIEALTLYGVVKSLPSKEAFIPKLETTVEEKHKGCDELEKELLKLGGLYAYRIIYDLMKE